MKALEKDRTRRYETAGAFARDVQRHLDGDPVEAGPPSAWYRMRKLATKHKTALAVSAAFALLLAVATVFSLGLAVWADGQRRRAEGTEKELAEQLKQVDSERQRAVTAERMVGEQLKQVGSERQRAVAAEGQAKDRLAQVEKANTLLGSIFSNLDPNSEEKEGKPLRNILADRLGQATHDLDGAKIGDPLTVAGLQTLLGVSLLNLGEYPRATVLLERAREWRESKLGTDHPLTLQGANSLAEAYHVAGRNNERSSCLSRRSRCWCRSWAPTTPLHSNAATTSPSPTMTLAATRRQSR